MLNWEQGWGETKIHISPPSLVVFIPNSIENLITELQSYLLLTLKPKALHIADTIQTHFHCYVQMGDSLVKNSHFIAPFSIS